MVAAILRAGVRGGELSTDAQAILIVEDDPMARTVIAEIVAMSGFQAVPSETVEAALDILESTHVAAILTDIRMPDRETGLGFIRTVRERWPNMPVVAVTGYPYDLASLEGDRECPSLIVHKPFHVSQIVDALRIARVQPRPLGACLEL